MTGSTISDSISSHKSSSQPALKNHANLILIWEWKMQLSVLAERLTYTIYFYDKWIHERFWKIRWRRDNLEITADDVGDWNIETVNVSFFGIIRSVSLKASLESKGLSLCSLTETSLISVTHSSVRLTALQVSFVLQALMRVCQRV